MFQVPEGLRGGALSSTPSDRGILDGPSGMLLNHSMAKKRLLIVDDDVGLTDLLHINLEDTGDYEVQVVNDSKHAISSTREFQPDLILLDIVMPGLDGGEIRNMLREDPELRDIPILVLTALVSSEDAGEEPVIHSGDQVMLPKPFRTPQLIQAIENTIAEAR